METRYLLITTCLAVLVFAVNAYDDSGPRILGGHTITNRKQIPYQVSIQYRGQHFCGGSIIDKKHILTAAHCFEEENKNNMLVWASIVNLKEHDNYQQSSKISHIFIHEKYVHKDEFISNDIAVLRLSKEFDIQTIQAIPWANKTGKPKITNCMVSGWGYKKPKGTVSTTLQAANITYIDRDFCKKQIYGDALKDGMICAGDYPQSSRDACQGDSGGPLVCGKVLTGIVSWGYECGSYGYPGVYTEVAYYNNWIKKTLQSSSGTTTTASVAIVVLTMFFTLY